LLEVFEPYKDLLFKPQGTGGRNPWRAGRVTDSIHNGPNHEGHFHVCKFIVAGQEPVFGHWIEFSIIVWTTGQSLLLAEQ
jgi:hypothetical protein